MRYASASNSTHTEGVVWTLKNCLSMMLAMSQYIIFNSMQFHFFFLFRSNSACFVVVVVIAVAVVVSSLHFFIYSYWVILFFAFVIERYRYFFRMAFSKNPFFTVFLFTSFSFSLAECIFSLCFICLRIYLWSLVTLPGDTYIQHNNAHIKVIAL